MQKKFFRLLIKGVIMIMICFPLSCGNANQKRKAFETDKSLRAAELRIRNALENSDVQLALRKLMPSQSFIFLAQFYGFTYNFGMPGCDEWELTDGWKRPLRFSINGNVARVWSIGSDAINQFGKGDDNALEIVIE